MSYTSSFIIHHIVNNIESYVIIGDIMEGVVSQGDKLVLTNLAGESVEATVLAMELDTESSDKVEFFRLFIADENIPSSWDINELIGKECAILNLEIE